MLNNAVTVGTPTSTGGKVLTGTAGVKINNLDVSVLGDQATCTCGADNCRGVGPIMQGSPRNIQIGGKLIAMKDDPVDTGCGNCFVLSSGDAVSLGSQTSGSINMGAGVNIGQGVNINMGSGVSFGQGRGNLAYTASSHTLASSTTQTVVEEKAAQEQWQPVQGNFPILVYETQKKMDDFHAPDMKYGDESKEKIEQYGFLKPFKQSEYNSHREGYIRYGEDQFSLPASEHFERMRSLGKVFSNVTVGSILGFETSSVFSEMVDKFERNEGGYYSNSLLSKALQGHETTQRFHEALKKCLGDNVKSGRLSDDILSVSSQYMMSAKSKPLPKFDSGPLGEDLYNGTVLTVHDIWSMRVYVEQLEYKGSQVRGTFKYEIQDHFGLDTNDINHDFSDGIKKQYEQLEGFRSWYLLQHFKGYGYKPFITKIDFEL